MAITLDQGWEFAHRFSERIARFLRKNEQMSNSLICSFLVSDLSESFMVAHFLVSNLSDLLTLLIYHELPEQIAHCHSFVMSDLSDSLTVAHLS